MAEFDVKPDILRTNESELALCSSDMRKIADAVVACKNTLAFSDETSSLIKNRLQAQYDELLSEAAKMDTFKDAILKIANHYTATENKITANHNVADDIRDLVAHSTAYLATSESTGADKRSGLRKFWDWLWDKDVDTKYTHTTKKQEEAADAAFQRKIESLTKKEKYTQRYWANASVEERKQILQDYMHEVEDILGVDVKSKIKFTNTGPNPDGTINYGAYNKYLNRVSINEYILNNYGSSSYALMATIVHELRHAYQHSAIKHPDRYQVTQETIDSWKESFRTYEKEQAKGHDAYLEIIVEKDARKFAGQA